MVATVLALRWRTVRHQLRRDWWRVLFLVGGAVWSLSLVPAILWGAGALSRYAPDVKEDALVAVTAVLMVGWIVVPLLVTGLDDTLEPARFATFGIEARRVMPGLAAAALMTVPAIFFAFVLVVEATTWATDGPSGWPLAVAIVGSALTWLILVFSARVSAAWAARLLASRRSREVALVAGLVVVATLGPAVWVIVRDGLDLVLEYDLRVLLEALGRTPLGGAFSAASAAADGNWWGVSWRLAMLATWAELLLLAWRANVAHAFVNPTFRGGGTRQRSDSVLAAAFASQRRSASAVAPWARSRLSLPSIAVRTRLTRYWASDSRYLSSLVGVLLVPILFVALILPVFSLDSRWMLSAPVLLAATIGWGRHNDVAYDSSAMWLDIVSGRLGTAVMRGRMAATLRWAAPSVVVVAAVAVAWTGLWEFAPAVVGACLGVLGATLGVSALSSVAFPYRAPAPGENPFGAEVGSVGAGLIAQLVSSAATAVVLPLVTAPLLLALAVDSRWGWAGLVLGVIVGPLTYVVGVRAAGVIYDKRSGRFIAAVT